MKKLILNLLNFFLIKYGHKIYKQKYVQELKMDNNRFRFFFSLPYEYQLTVLPFLKKTKSQILQDIFVIQETNGKRNGFFVDFGATDGIELNNTYILEKELGWDGILSEPAKIFHEMLRINRSCHIDINCVWNKTGEKINFHQDEISVLSTIKGFENTDYIERKNGNIFEVGTITLEDLLTKYNAPKTIDYLSIDTEGSEYEIIRDFDFNKWEIKIITIEHNFNKERRELIFELLSKQGYVRKYENYSSFDDWYVKN